MHIKKIKIQGFKTYKNETIVNQLSPHCNAVVGRNGSGKSNFFAAIRFVLSDAYTHMTREERQSLIHDGSGTIMSAYVEVVFDNTDKRFPIGKDEISIRRTIGLKKDDYSLDGKSATRSDVMHLLESAGFSRSNPYYIVPQGRITSLTNSKDHERLLLLKEVSGANVFENKLKESMKEMAQSEMKCQRIDEALQNIQERINDLQIESADLKDFQHLEKQKKILEFNIFDREINELNESIEELSSRHEQLLAESHNDLSTMEKREKLCVNLQNAIKDLNVNLKVVTAEKEEAFMEHDSLLKLFATKEVALNELRNSLEGSGETLDGLEKQMREVEMALCEAGDAVKKHEPHLNKLQDQEKILKSQLQELIAEQRALYSKQFRFLKHATKEQRDTWLSKEISRLRKESKLKEQEIKEISALLMNFENEDNKISGKISEAEKFSTEYADEISTLKLANTELKTKITECVDSRKHLWREEIKLRSVKDSLTNDLINTTNSLNQTMAPSVAQGLSAVTKAAQRLDLESNIYGTVAELFSINEKYKVAAEAIAGTSLFHVVVDTDATAATLIEELNRNKSGRITFIPLNRIEPLNIQYPDSQENQCIPLISKIKCNDENVGKAMQQIFGKALVVKDLQRGSELSRKFKLTCITLDGDRADVKGAISGGYRDYKVSRIDALKLQRIAKTELKKTEVELEKVVEKINQCNQTITSVNNELQLNTRDLDKLLESIEQLKQDLVQATTRRLQLQESIFASGANLVSLQSARDAIISKIKHHEQELDSDFSRTLSDNEAEKLQKLNSEIAAVELQMDQILATITVEENEHNELDNTRQRLVNQCNMLAQQIRTFGDKKVNVQALEELESECNLLKYKLANVLLRSEELVVVHKKISDEIAQNEEALSRANKQQLTSMTSFETYQKESSRIVNQKLIKEQTKAEINNSIKNLGIIPQFGSDDFAGLTTDEMAHQLKKVNEDLVKYSHINRKALEQYNQFTKQQEDLRSRREDLDVSKQSIEDLIKNLQKQKKDAIMNSFKQVAEAFHNVFEQLVPQGIGYLTLQRKLSLSSESQLQNQEHQTQDVDFDEASDYQDSIDNYTGVAISVSFNSKDDEQQKIEQLSGGQKSLCAIALIFAIQHCDPAPFYLFDEIDSNLDTQYRTSVAALIKSLSSQAQFICTTFRPELLSLAADKFYGVVFTNKVSNILEIDKEEAMNFVEGHSST